MVRKLWQYYNYYYYYRCIMRGWRNAVWAARNCDLRYLNGGCGDRRRNAGVRALVANNVSAKQSGAAALINVTAMCAGVNMPAMLSAAGANCINLLRRRPGATYRRAKAVTPANLLAAA